MKINQKYIVSSLSPRHPGRVGYFRYRGQGIAKNLVMLADEPYDLSVNDIGFNVKVFAVNKNYLLHNLFAPPSLEEQLGMLTPVVQDLEMQETTHS